jgi:hypothetical protein
MPATDFLQPYRKEIEKEDKMNWRAYLTCQSHDGQLETDHEDNENHHPGQHIFEKSHDDKEEWSLLTVVSGFHQKKQWYTMTLENANTFNNLKYAIMVAIIKR